MPAHRIAPEVLELRGAYRKNPQRRRPIGAKSAKGLGRAPAHLTGLERDCWLEVTGNAPPGVLTSADRILIELVSRLLAKLREKGLDGLRGAELAQLTGALSRLGWTPADRSRVPGAVAKEDENPFAVFDEFRLG